MSLEPTATHLTAITHTHTHSSIGTQSIFLIQVKHTGTLRWHFLLHNNKFGQRKVFAKKKCEAQEL